MTGYLGMDLPRFVAVVRSRAWLIAGIVAAAVLLALVASLTQADRYRATADLLFGRTSTADAIVAGGAADTGDVPERAAATNLALAELDTVAARVKRQLRTSASVEELKAAVTVDTAGASDVGTVTAEWSTPEQAAAVANAFAAQIVATRREGAQADLQRAIDALSVTLNATPPAATGAADSTRALRDQIARLRALKAVETGGVRIVEQATPPEQRSSPKPARNAVIAGLVALALALFVVVLLARFDKRISDEDELAEVMGVPVLARIPQPTRSRRLHANGRHEDPAFLEAFEFLRLNLQLMGPKGSNVVLAVTSPTAGNGKTTVVAWLSRALALSGAEVLAVDLDRRKPDLHNYLNAYGEPDNGVFLPERNHDGDAPAADQPPSRRVYTAEDIRAGLTELAQCGGNARAAARSLKLDGHEFSESTLRRWKRLHAPLYAEIGARTREASPTVTAEPGGRPTLADELTQPTRHPHVRLVTGGDDSPLPMELLGTDRLPQLFAELRNNADYVLVDTVPVSTVADASAVAAAADGVILVVDLDRISRRELLAAKKQLGHARADVLGIVLNRATVDFHGYGSDDVGDPAAAERPRSEEDAPRS
jgi:Mrp family chromosome partitioning ATPase/LPS O-antigen subunit length determinant protein (WzzB/FepE family)